MRDLTIGKNEAGQRMDKYLKKYFPEAGSGFLYKMLRKKNILLNEKKADGKEMLKQGDRIRLYLADQTERLIALAKEKINKKGHHPAEITDQSKCVGCAFCAIMCPDCIIEVER